MCKGQETGQCSWVQGDWKVQFKLKCEGSELQQVFSSGFVAQMFTCVLGHPWSG